MGLDRLALAALLAAGAGGCALVDATGGAGGDPADPADPDDPDDEDDPDPIDDEDDDPFGGGFVLKLADASLDAPAALTVIDVAGDPAPDVGLVDVSAQRAHLYVNDGAADFEDHAVNAPASSWLFAGIYIDDGAAQPGRDLAFVADDGRITALDGDGEGGFAARAPSMKVEPALMAPFRFSEGSDGMVMVDAHDYFKVIAPLGTGHFDSTTLTTAPVPTQFHNALRSADVDLDGDLDVLLAADEYVFIAYHVGDGLEPWVDAIDLNFDGYDAQAIDVTVADFVGDDHPDLLVLVEGGPAAIAIYEVGLDGDEYVFARGIDVGVSATSVLAGDADGDRRQDVFLFDAAAGGDPEVTVVLATPAWDFSEVESYASAPPQVAAVGDFDGDGRDDFAVASGAQADGVLEVWCSRMAPPEE